MPFLAVVIYEKVSDNWKILKLSKFYYYRLPVNFDRWALMTVSIAVLRNSD